MGLRLQHVTPMVSPQLPRLDARGVTMRNTARQTCDNRTITVDFRSEATYFQLLGDGKAFLECVLAFMMAIGFQLKHKATCDGGGCLTRHSHYVRVRLSGVTIWRIQCTRCKAVIGRQSCFQCYCTHLIGSCQGKQEHAPADDEYARRSIRCFLTYLRIRRCACVRQRILRVCRCIGSL